MDGYYKQRDGISKTKSKGHALLQNVFDGLVGRLYPAKKNISLKIINQICKIKIIGIPGEEKKENGANQWMTPNNRSKKLRKHQAEETLKTYT